MISPSLAPISFFLPKRLEALVPLVVAIHGKAFPARTLLTRMTEKNTNDDNDGCNDNYDGNFDDNDDKNDKITTY